MMTKTKTTIDHTTFTITFQRSLSVPREEVFDAWTDADQIKEWWDPTGTPLADCAVDLRPGGAFCFTTASTHAPPFAGTYESVERPAELVFHAMGGQSVQGALLIHISSLTGLEARATGSARVFIC